MSRTQIHERVDLARRGLSPQVICRMPSGWAVLGDVQILRGYSLLLPDPVVPSLDSLELDKRLEYLRDMALLGSAVLEVTRAARINYEILGNLEPALHAHTIPRYASEPPELRTKAVWFYDWSVAPKLDAERDGPLQGALKAVLQRKLADLGGCGNPRDLRA